MTRPYSVDLRERVVRAVEAGASCRATAATFEVSVSFVIKLMQRWRQRGSMAPDRYGGWKRSALAAHGARVRELLMLEPDLTIAELRRRLAGEKITTSPAAIPRRRRPDAKKDPARRRAGTARRHRGAARLAHAATGAEPRAPRVRGLM